MTSIENSTGFIVVRTARHMKRALDNRLAKIAVTASQHTILSTLAKDDGLPLSEVGKRVYLDKPAITGLADRLENDALVESDRVLVDSLPVTFAEADFHLDGATVTGPSSDLPFVDRW